jgi:hypothetical protein
MKEQPGSAMREGRITVPTEICTALDSKIGDEAAALIDEGSGVPPASPQPVRSVAEMTFGIFQSGVGPAGEEAIREAFTDHAAARDERSKRA